jgi:predicted DsbA family dithiol-disulfide isomerase
MFNDVNRIIARNGWQGINVEYIQDIQQIMSYGVMATPVLVIDEKVVMVGHRGAAKIEQALREGSAA